MEWETTTQTASQNGLLNPYFRLRFHEYTLLNQAGDFHAFELQLQTPVFGNHWSRKLHKHRRGKQNCFSSQYIALLRHWFPLFFAKKANDTPKKCSALSHLHILFSCPRGAASTNSHLAKENKSCSSWPQWQRECHALASRAENVLSSARQRCFSLSRARLDLSTKGKHLGGYKLNFVMICRTSVTG